MAAPQMAATMGATLGKTTKGSEAVKVVVRVRPLSGTEVKEGRQKTVQMDINRGVAILHKPGGTERDCKDFTYDAVFDDTMSQQQIFDDTALEIVDSVMDGFNGTVFAYGQTGAGKSHTMTGPENAPLELQGLLPRSFLHIFENINTASGQTKYLVRGSFLEIYNEEIRDLLSKNPTERCELKDHPNSGVYVKDLSLFVVSTAAEMTQVLAAGLMNRSVGATKMNAESSRSHSIFLVTVEQAALGADGEGHIRVGKLNMVDLAGSERQSKTGATGDRLKEATKINLSLSALGNVISALVDGKSAHIPYRDSKLTRLLMDSLGGNTKTVMVANIGPADYNYDETLSTLRYAHRAKSIKNKPRINEDPKDAMIREFQEEVMRLKAELATAGGGEGPDGANVDIDGVPRQKLPPRIEKKVEYVEKIVEKTIEREVVIEQGPAPEELAALEAEAQQKRAAVKAEADRKRADVMAQLGVAESERKRLLSEVEREEKKALEEQTQKADLQRKLASMEQKMVVGKQVMEKAIEQEEELRRKERELRKQKKIEDKLKSQEEQQRVENLELETKCASQEEQVTKMSAKLHKLWDKYQKAQQEMVDVQQFNQGEREDMLSMIRDLRQTLKLKTLIMESFVPVQEIQNTRERAVWDAEEDEWRVRPMKVEVDRQLEHPASAQGLPRPTSEYTLMNRRLLDPNPRHMYDCILMTDLDLHDRTTEDFEVHPELGDTIERSLMLALSPDDDESCWSQSGQPASREGGGGDDRERSRQGRSERPTTGQRRRPSSGRPGTGNRTGGSAAFPQARGLVSRE